MLVHIVYKIIFCYCAQVEMAHKVLSSDMAELINAMRLAQQYSTTLLDSEYRKGMLKAAHVLAMDSKNLLDAVQNARKQGAEGHNINMGSVGSGLVTKPSPKHRGHGVGVGGTGLTPPPLSRTPPPPYPKPSGAPYSGARHAQTYAAMPPDRGQYLHGVPPSTAQTLHGVLPTTGQPYHYRSASGGSLGRTTKHHHQAPDYNSDC